MSHAPASHMLVHKFRELQMEIAPIKTRRDYKRVLKEIEGLMNAKRNTPEGDRLDVLVTLVEWKQSTIRWTCRMRSRRSNTTWIKRASPRVILFHLSAAATASMRCSRASAR